MTKKLLKISKYRPSIFQGKLDFSSAHRGVSLSLEHPAERLVLRVLSIALLALVCGYLYFVSASVLNVIARKEALARVVVIQGSIGGLEQEYFKLSQSVTAQTGEALGLSPVGQPKYVYRPGNVGAATIARNEI